MIIARVDIHQALAPAIPATVPEPDMHCCHEPIEQTRLRKVKRVAR